MKRIFFLSACIFILHLVVLPPLICAEDYGLEDLYRIALSRSEKMKVSEENINIAKLGRDKAHTALVPNLTSYATYTQYSQKVLSDTGSNVQPSQAGTWGLLLTQTLSLGGREFIALDVAGKTIEKGRYDLISLQQDYLVSITTAFYDLLKAKSALEIANSNLERLTKYRDAANSRLRAGQATKTAVLRADGDLSGARSEKIKVVNTLEAAKYSLARLVGIAGPFDIKETAGNDAVGPGTMDELKDMALGRRIELKSLALQKTMAEKQVSYVKSAFWPDLSLGAAYARVDDDAHRTTFLRDSTYATVGLNFPLYDSGYRRADVMEAEAKLRQADLLYRDAVKTINLEVENSYLDFTTQQGIIKFLQDQLAYAQDNYTGVTKQYEFGLANSIDVIDANNLLLTSQRQLADAILSSHYYLLVLKRASGTLLGEGRETKP